MSSQKRRVERWEYPSLEWIHRVRAQIYEKERGRPLMEIPSRLSRGAAAIAKRLNLRTIHAQELPIRRRSRPEQELKQGYQAMAGKDWQAAGHRRGAGSEAIKTTQPLRRRGATRQ